MPPARLFLFAALVLASCAPPAAPAPALTFTPQPSASTATFTLTPAPPTLTPTPELGIGSTWASPIDKMEMVYVPAGSFLMGSSDADPLATSEENPQHSVTLDAYWIDRTEVTVGMYTLCVDRHVCREPTHGDSAYHNQYYDDPQGRFDNYPVIWVNWTMAQTYCEWAGRHLPTEAQWEKAARGTDGRIYPWGNDPPNHDLANYDGYFGDTLNVSRYSKGASPYGALDMAGNVLQWVSDWYSETYYQISPTSNPGGPDSGDLKVLRGSDYNHSDYHTSAYLLRAAERFGLDREFASYNVGFRCARNTSP